MSSSDLDDNFEVGETSNRQNEESEYSSDDSDSFIQFGNLDIKEFNYRVNMKATYCCCVEPDCGESAVGIFIEMINNIIVVDNINCILNSIIACCNYVLCNHTEINDHIRLAFCDYFYRLRHELLFKLVMLTLNLPQNKSDIPFSSLDIDSNRTPDYIKIDGNNLIVMEIAATSNFEKTAVMKGLVTSGYESKYNKEIELLTEKGYFVDYMVIIFDMNSFNIDHHVSEINKRSEVFYINKYFMSYLNLLYKEFCTITFNIKDYLYPVSSFLFLKTIPIEDYHPKLSFLYTKEKFEPDYKYVKFTISSQVYNKISVIWHRILIIYENFNKEFKGKFKPVLSITNNRLSFIEDKGGFDFESIRDIIVNNDKPSFFSNLDLSVGNTRFPAVGSETGVEFCERVDKIRVQQDSNYQIPFLLSHIRVKVKRKVSDSLEHYKLRIKEIFKTNFKPKFFDPKYEELYIKMIYEDDLCKTDDSLEFKSYKLKTGLDLLSENDLSLVNIDNVMKNIKDLYFKNNDFNESIPLKKPKMKQSFILPIANISQFSYDSLKNKNINLLSGIYKNLEGNEYTKTILMKVLDDNYSFIKDKVQPTERYLTSLKTKYSLSNEITALYKNAINNIKDKTEKIKFSLKKCTDKEIESKYLTLRNDMSRIDKELDRIAKEDGIKQNIEFLRLPTKNKKTVLGSYFQSEMSHFLNKDKRLQSTIEGYGIPNDYSKVFEDVKCQINDLCSSMTDFRGQNPDPLIDLNCFDDSRLLKDLKTQTIKNYEKLISDIKDSMLGHSSAFVSRLGHSLMFYSQLPFNSDYIRVDNLGYNDVLLIVRGGKKIFKSKSSKLFRLFFPIHNDAISLYIDQSVGESSYTLLNIDGVDYLLSPWMMIHESILSDSISFYPRVMSFCVLNLDYNIDFKSQFHKVCINVLLAFHNRRQTEVFLANMRYILLSTMGDYTGIMKIFPDFCGFNYDKFQFFLRTSIFENYSIFFKKMRILQKDGKANENRMMQLNISNIFTGFCLNNSNELTLMIYSTFLMTKGPYQRPAERAINLLNMLKIHQEVKEKVTLTDNPETQLENINVCLNDYDHFEDYVKDLFKNDYVIDAKYVSNLGWFANNYFENLNLKDKIQVEWIKILNKEWDSMATSTGLRGRPEDIENFWGQKGYFVVYKFLLKDEEYKNNIHDLFNSSIESHQKQKMIRVLNQTYLEKIGINYDKGLLFHVVDKVQWRGSREIFVMDMDTKVMQQPIEKMMAFLCKNIDNELISIPSDKRAQIIHHTIFEKDLPLKDALTWFLTLDCSKWAPKSMFIKFSLMLLSMPILPSSFVSHFLNYSEKLFYKKIYYNKAEVKVLQNNSLYSGIIDEFLIEDKKLNGYYMLMPYSWVMGIFNYTSSFMHAFNQKYASYLINKTSRSNFGEETTMVMFAHSDDSGGRITSVSQKLIERGLYLYEVQLKCCNHLLSKKKSVISRTYFEILSIIYLFSKLMALLPKFLGGLRFTPTDKGPCHDMLQSYSKSIEVCVAGADFSIAYLVMKFYSMMVWRFYNKVAPHYYDYMRPVQYFGMPDAHPLMVLLTGSDSDILRIFCNSNKKLLLIIHKLMGEINLNNEDEGIIRPMKFNIKVRNIKKGFEEHIEEYNEILSTWTIGNVNFKSSPFNALNFLKKLNDPGFVGSLVNETPVRRISRSYYLRKGQSIVTTKGFYRMSEMMSAIKIVTDFVVLGKESDLSFVIDITNDHFKSILESLNDSTWEENPLFKILNNILAGPIKLNSYFNKLSLEGKDFRHITRTLKPTQLQLLKIGSSFSCNFDAAQLVSYVKEPQFRWALPDLKNLPIASEELNKLLEVLGLNLTDLDESTLLKLIRMHVSKTQKDIYLYSQIPGEIRSIKTYAAMLIFLSSNSFKDTEISGLSLKLKGTLTDPGYLESSINEDIYYINTLCSIIIMFLKSKFNLNLSELRIKRISNVGWEGGDLLSFIYHLENKRYFLQDFIYLRLYINYIISKLHDNYTVPASILQDTAFYTFTKEQKKRSGWYGSGQIMIVIGKKFFIFHIIGSNITMVESNHKGKLDRTLSSFLLETCVSCNINLASNYFKSNNKIDSELAFGFDHTNELSVLEKREISRGVPFRFLKRTPLILNQLDFGEITHIRENLFICNMFINNEYKSFKIYGLKISKSNIVDTIRNLFFKDDFEKLMLEEGVGDFTEFIITELLTDFGEDVTITKEEIFDNIFASESFKIFSEVKNKNSHLLPKILKTARVPAEEGSFPRILLAYSESTGIDVIKNYKTYDPNMMAIRSEYPESFSLVLSEKMIECHNKLFTIDENNEMLKAYISLSKVEDKDELSKRLISLMCYWGYGSLVNSINLYDFKKKGSNYMFVRMTRMDDTSCSIYNNVFTTMVTVLINVMLSNSTCYSSLEKVLKNVGDHLNLNEVLSHFLRSLAMNAYNYENPLNYVDLNSLYFINTLLGYLKVPEFCEQVEAAFSKVVPLNTLPIDFNFRKEIVSVYNTLKVIYYKSKDLKAEFDYIKIVDRDIGNITLPINIINEFGVDIVKPKDLIYHYGFLNNYIIDKMKSKIRINTKKKNFIINQCISGLSKTSVPVIKELAIIRPLNEDFLESEQFEELSQELTFDEIDIDTITELWEEYTEDPYVKRETRFKGKTVYAKIHWVIIPYMEGKRSFKNYLRQIGENVVVVTNSLMDISNFPNSYQFLTNFSEISGGDLPDTMLYTFGNKALDKDFWSELFGENEFKIKLEQLEPLGIDLINTERGIVSVENMGSLGSDVLLTKGIDELNEDFKKILGENKVITEDIAEEEYKMGEISIKEKLNKAVAEGLIDNKISERLLNKYYDLNRQKKMDISELLESLLEEIDINMLSVLFEKTLDLGLNKNQIVKIYQTPEHFGLAKSTDYPDKNPIMNSKLRAEIEAFCSGLSSKLVSGSLTISNRYLKLLKSSFKIWKTHVLATSYKKENKKFLIKLMNSILNSSFKTNDNTDDNLWQTLINNVQELIAQDEEDDDSSDDDSFIQFDYNITHSSRLQYRFSGFQ